MIRRAIGAAQNHGRIFIFSLTLCSLASAGAVWWYYQRQLTAMEEQVIRELRAVSDNKTKQIATWRGERLGDGHVLLSPAIMGVAEKILSDQARPDDSAHLSELLQRYEDAFL